MKYKTLIKKVGLCESDFKEIEEAVQKAESGTSGEITLAITAESESYAFWELAAATVSAFLLLCGLFPMANNIYDWLGRIFWNVKPWYLVAFYIIVCGIVIAGLYLLYNIPWIDSHIIPNHVKEKAVTNRAMRYFTESGVYCTREHTGILIFVSYFEHEVRIIADKGLNDKIEDDLWKQIADEVAASIAKKSVKDGFLMAIEKCGTVFAKNFPTDVPDSENPNELSDSLVILKE